MGLSPLPPPPVFRFESVFGFGGSGVVLFCLLLMLVGCVVVLAWLLRSVGRYILFGAVVSIELRSFVVRSVFASF